MTKTGFWILLILLLLGFGAIIWYISRQQITQNQSDENQTQYADWAQEWMSNIQGLTGIVTQIGNFLNAWNEVFGGHQI